MEEQKSNKKIDASIFLSQNKIDVEVPKSFKDGLQQKLFQEYINYYDRENMKSSTFSSKKFKFSVGFTSLALIIISLTVAYFVFGKNGSETNKKTLLGADIAYVEGDLEIQDKNNQWNNVNQNTQIAENDKLRINGEGKAIINIDDGSAVRLDSNSQVTLSSLDPNNIIVTNDQGKVYTRVAKAERTFEVKVSNATLTSLGTAYQTINKSDEKSVEVYESKVKVSNNSKETVVDEGNKYFLTDDKVSKLDDEKVSEDEFTLWNKDQDMNNNEKLGYLENIKKKEVVVVEPTVEPTVAPTAKPNPTVIIKPTKVVEEEPAPTANPSLSISIVSNGGTLVSWSVSGGQVLDGFKLLWSKSPNPTYPVSAGGFAGYYENNKFSGDISWGSNDGPGTYYVRVCQYVQGTCGVYSNQITVELQ